MKIHSFHAKLLILFSGLIAVVQIATFLAVLLTSKHNIGLEARDDVRVGARVFYRLLIERGEQLASKVQILTSQYPFREVVATQDVTAIQSALGDYGAEVGAGVAMLASLDGKLIASTHHHRSKNRFPFPHLLERGPEEGSASAVLMFRGQPYQFVLVPVHAHDAWVCMGFRIDEETATDFKSLTSLDVSLLGQGPRGNRYVLASTLDAGEALGLLKVFPEVASATGSEPFILDGTDRLTLRIRLAEYASHKVIAVIQTSMPRQLAPYYRIQWQLVWVSMAALILSIVAATLLARNVTRPVQALISAAREIENGSYARAVEVDRKDEIGMLAATFNSIVHRAHHDALTGLPNRAVVGDRLSMSLARAERNGSSFALLMMDLNRFKEINDTLGHLTGDLVLQETAKRLVDNARASDTVARLGGDEFLVLLEDIDERQALQVARKLMHALTQPIALAQMRISPKVSMGIALYPVHASKLEALLRRADIAMYHAKETKTPIAIYETGQDERHLRQIALLNDLRRAIDRSELFLHYQPKIALATGQLAQVEALVRWRHPAYGVLPPDEFIPLAEESGQLQALTAWVLRAAISQARAWRSQGLEVAVAVNLSALDLLDMNLPDTITQCLSAYGVGASNLILEITEGAVMRDPAHAVQVLDSLKDIGIRLAIDDFGTGYSSLTQLKRLPVDEIKIDKSFVMHLKESDEDAVIVRSTIDLAHNMGLEVTAEGVETGVCSALLESYGCDLAQGYLISPPLPAEELMDWKRDHDHRQLRYQALHASGAE
ncbi:MAG: putative bifunctional diguanylate cyclase/phosphodiesterase [Gammaproteobacteria bacterium]